MTNASTGAKIKARRLELGLGLREAARAANISATYWTDLEAGDRSPSDLVGLSIDLTLDWHPGTVAATIPRCGECGGPSPRD